MAYDVLDEFLAQPNVGVLASLRADGRPYTVPVWWLWRDGGFWVSGTTARVWCKQLLKDSRVSLCVEAMTPIAGHFGVDGRARAYVPPAFDIEPITRELATKYLGVDGKADSTLQRELDEFVSRIRVEPRLLFHVEPEVWRAIDMRVYAGKRQDREYGERLSAPAAPTVSVRQSSA